MSIVTLRRFFAFYKFTYYDRTINTSICSNLSNGSLKSLFNNLYTSFLIITFNFYAV